VASAACASSNVAIGVGLEWLRSGLCDVVLCGGVDALHEFVIAGFASLRAQSPSPCRPFDAERSGLNLGEGAAFLVLELESQARARGQRIRAHLAGAGLSCDANHMTGPDRQGRGAARAMQAALVDADLTAADIDFVSAHGTATLFNDQMEGLALASLFGARLADVPVNSIKGSIGHTLGAAGALEAVMAVRVLEEQCIPPTAGLERRDEKIRLDVVAGAPRAARVRTVLSTSSGFGGLNAAIVLRAAEGEGAR
jgi:3-oxoacyl-[acyl-carrier-protein] synthase II